MEAEAEAERSSTSSEDISVSSYDSSLVKNPNSEEEQREEEEQSDCNDYEDVHQAKRRKYVAVFRDSDDEDRISDLSDSIILSILAFLPTKDAIKTGVLSKRWVQLWTSIPSLSFSDAGYFKNAKVFASNVDSALLLHSAPKLSNFLLEFWYNSQFKTRVDDWVRFATAAKVDQLSLKLSSNHYKNSEAYVLPEDLYANEFVSEFEFCFCKIFPTGVVNWSSLKRLCIGYTALPEEAIAKVLMGSPKLEYLELCNCCQVKLLGIVSDSLRKLVIKDHLRHSYFPAVELEIVAPKIESLEILGNFDRNKCRIKDVSALVEAKLDFHMSMGCRCKKEDACKEYQDIVRGLLESVHHVKELTVGPWCLMVLSIMSVKHRPFPSLKCKRLTVKTSMKKWDFLGIASLLQSSPYVETLVMDIKSPDNSGSEFNVSNCFWSHLKELGALAPFNFLA
ncbi:putative F-box protein At1g49610 isoform X2 [Castanea sativa]|uniref:putative F-box protein At1g49610 isoform X2 n=1 Tax=Castanea sativa TaxID=21020 RepID=UPI003F64ECA3